MMPVNPQETFALALEHHRAGRLAEAEPLYRQILATQPAHADALHLLGVIAHQCGRHEAARQLIGQAIALDPNHHAAHSNLGIALRACGRPDEAIAAFQRALQIRPDNAEALTNLGDALRAQGRLDEAVAACREAIRLQPECAEAFNNLGIAVGAQGHREEALAAYARSLELKPANPEALANFGDALREGGRLDEAIGACQRALELEPDYAAAHNNLGIALAAQGRLGEAIASYQSALRFKPAYADAWNNLGNALRDRGLLDEAVAAFREALRLEEDLAAGHESLGCALLDQGLREEGVAEFRRALALQPGLPRVQSNVILAQLFDPQADAAAVAAERQSWDRNFARPRKTFIAPHTNDRDPARRLRIGYVSPDFRDHVVGQNVRPLFRHHDHDAFEIHGYSCGTRTDAWTEEFRRQADHWCDVAVLSDDALAARIREDGIDILVDLMQHTARNRLPVFARKPAPVQVSFAGYPDTTGLEAIEYRISDRWLEAGASEMEDRTAEQVHLIPSFWCYDPHGAEVEVNRLPALETGFVTFGSLNHFWKVNEPLARLWARVLREVADSRFVLLCGAGSHRQRLLGFFASEGIEARRVEFVEPRARAAYLKWYHRLDLVLDPFPYNGHSTSLEALWMGVPVVSLAGATRVSRGGLSILNNLGLPEWVAHSSDDYVRIASELACDPARLAALRGTLRGRMQSSVLMNPLHFTRSIESAYRAMWQYWCAGPHPEPHDHPASP
jgi:predicted O-linked N-acetylglucosamine transferase (SPINDLY family)